MSAHPGPTPDPQTTSDDTAPMASPDLAPGYEDDSNRPDLVDPAGEQILPEELTEVNGDDSDKTGLHDRSGDQQRFS